MMNKGFKFLVALSVLILFSSYAAAFSIGDLLDGLARLFSSVFGGNQGSDQGNSHAFVCNPPYIQVGKECCLDSNVNGVCDKDETTETTQATETTQSTQPPQEQTTSTVKRETTTTSTTSISATTTVPRTSCTKNSDCGETTKKRVCYNNDVYEQTNTPYCANAGKPQAECKTRASGIFVGSQLLAPLQDCDKTEQVCWNGECVGEIPSTTTSTTQGPTTTQRQTTTTQQGQTTTTQQGATTTTIRTTTTTIIIVSCQGDLYDSSNCNGGCNQACETCERYQQSPCYYCRKDCSRLGAGWATSASCDGQHEVLETSQTCSGCYRCNEVCPEPDYYRLQGCNGKCPTILCRQVKVHEPQSQYKDCYKCYPPVCGNDIIEPGEQCEDDLDCPDYHVCNLNCQCATDCAGYCTSRGVNGYPQSQGIATKALCEADMNAKMAALNCQNQAKCGAYAWMDGLTADCCCVDVQCGATVDACKAKL